MIVNNIKSGTQLTNGESKETSNDVENTPCNPAAIPQKGD
jgi:hypothetical protein